MIYSDHYMLFWSVLNHAAVLNYFEGKRGEKHLQNLKQVVVFQYLDLKLFNVVSLPLRFSVKISTIN